MSENRLNTNSNHSRSALMFCANDRDKFTVWRDGDFIHATVAIKAGEKPHLVISCHIKPSVEAGFAPYNSHAKHNLSNMQIVTGPDLFWATQKIRSTLDSYKGYVFSRKTPPESYKQSLIITQYLLDIQVRQND
jgi:hypothetical protein